MYDKVITFSIAAYNIEKYIDKCVGSILETERYGDIEILIIDDGSSDKTADIARDYEKRYPDTVRLISKKNGGHGSTINTGIKEARGRYFRVIDGDDWVDPKDTGKLVEKLRSENSDVVLCNFYDCYNSGPKKNTTYSVLEDGRVYSMRQINSLIGWMRYHAVVFRTDILRNNDIVLDEHCFYVDTELMVLSVPYISSIKYYDLFVYCYRLDNEGQSVSESSRMKNILHSKRVSLRLLKYYRLTAPTLDDDKKKYMTGGIAGPCMWHFRGLTFFAPDENKRKELVRFDRYVKRISPEIYNTMTTPALNRSEKDAKLIKLLRKCNYKLYNTYGFYKKTKGKIKDFIKKNNNF